MSARWQASDGRLLTATVHPANEHLTATNVAHAAALPVVLLHGLSQQRRFWDPVVARMRSPLIATVDQRGHGDSLLPVDADYGIERCALDVVELLDELGWQQAVVVGHSWGASVALHCAGSGRAAAVGLIDGGLWGPSALGDREQVRERLRPPALGIPPASLWALVESSSPWLGPEARAALSHTFIVGEDGLIRTRIGVDRHMRVLDGLLDYRPDEDLQRLACPAWAVVCEPAGSDGSTQDPWAVAKEQAIERARAVPGLLIHRWMGAVHDVPLQWPALVAGFIDALRASVEPLDIAGQRPTVDGQAPGRPQ